MGEEEASGVRVRLFVELRLGTRSFDLTLPAIPAAGEIIEITEHRRCIVGKVIDAPKDSPLEFAGSWGLSPLWCWSPRLRHLRAPAA